MAVEDFARFFMLFMNLQENKETVVLQFDKSNEHYTFQLRHRERELDLHRTKVLPNGTKVYETLFKVSFYSIARLVAILIKERKRLESKIETLEDLQREFPIEFRNPGWFRKHYMQAVLGTPENLTELGLFRTKNRGRQLRFVKDLSSFDQSAMFKMIDSELEPGTYPVFRWNKGGSASFCGLLSVLPNGPKRFIWIPKKVPFRMMRQAVPIVLSELGRMQGPGVKELTEAIHKKYPRLELERV